MALTASEATIRRKNSPQPGRKLPRRDYLVLPLLSLGTVAVLLCGSELVTRMIFPPEVDDTCVFTDPIKGPYNVPNCVGHERAPESPLIENRYNACGYRSLQGCDKKLTGTIRVAVIGSSFAEALLVPMEQTYQELTQRELQHACGKPVEVENLAAPMVLPTHVLARMDEVLNLQPDAVFFVITPIDLESLLFSMPGQIEWRSKVKGGGAASNFGLYKRIQNFLLNSRTVFGVEHALFATADVYTKFYLLYGDKADYLRQPFTPAWQQRFADIESIIGQIADDLRRNGIPLYITAAPSRATTAVLNSSSLPSDVDPYAWGDRIAQICRSHGAHYVDLLHAFGQDRSSARLFYVVDGHLKAEGQPIVSEALVSALRRSDAAAFSSCRSAGGSSGKAMLRTRSVQ